MLKLFSRKKANAKAELQEVLGEFELPTFPSLIMNLLAKVRDPESHLSTISDLAASDPGLTVRLLDTVNSAAFSLRHKVTNIHHAVSLLGRGSLESMLISLAVRDALPRKPTKGFEARRFWRTCARRATTAGRLAELIDPATRSESFTASLLQDMAVPILAQRRGDYDEILTEWHHRAADLAQMEQDAFGWDHARMAACMCDEWKFPEALAHSIANHHGTGDGQVPLPAANLVATLRESGESGIEQLVERAHGEYHVPKDDLLALIDSSFEEAEETASLFA